MSDTLVASSFIIESVPNATEESRVLARKLLEKKEAFDIIEMLDL